MSKPEVLEKAPMNVVEVKQALEKINKNLSEEDELNFRAGKTLEYGQDFAKITVKQAADLKKRLEGLEIARMKDLHIQKLIDILPGSDKHVKIILSSYHLTVKNDDVKKIADVIGEFIK